MRELVACLMLVGCSFHAGQPTVSTRDGAANLDVLPDTERDAPVSTLDSAVMAICGNGVVETGEDCEIGDVGACSTSCGTTGTRTCTSSCNFDACEIVVDPATAWEVSTNGTTWAPVALPSTNWGCTSCTRYFRTTVCDVPSSVDFVWSSDNRARMQVNGTSAFATYWLTNYCTDAVCCSKCCDTSANCQANLSAQQTLGAPALALFTSGANVVRWEVGQETGGSGFHARMTIRY